MFHFASLCVTLLYCVSLGFIFLHFASHCVTLLHFPSLWALHIFFTLFYLALLYLGSNLTVGTVACESQYRKQFYDNKFMIKLWYFHKFSYKDTRTTLPGLNTWKNKISNFWSSTFCNTIYIKWKVVFFTHYVRKVLANTVMRILLRVCKPGVKNEIIQSHATAPLIKSSTAEQQFKTETKSHLIVIM